MNDSTGSKLSNTKTGASSRKSVIRNSATKKGFVVFFIPIWKEKRRIILLLLKRRNNNTCLLLLILKAFDVHPNQLHCIKSISYLKLVFFNELQ